jgi:hypothetical protein
MRDEVDRKVPRADCIDGKADAVDGDRALRRDVPREFRGRLDLEQNAAGIRARRLGPGHGADAVDMTGQQMTTYALAETQSFLEIDPARAIEPGRATQRLG